MKLNERDQLKQMSVEELRNKLAELTEERFRLRFRSATESVDNPMRFRSLRRDIARVKTLLRTRELAK
ncbi:MAG TPA: 50S ribosomal protein L29 [Gemmatimonadales bacterium]|nr:50S ribosomal protein L29 [Gemmatimonadales bacterium]